MRARLLAAALAIGAHQASYGQDPPPPTLTVLAAEFGAYRHLSPGAAVRTGTSLRVEVRPLPGANLRLRWRAQAAWIALGDSGALEFPAPAPGVYALQACLAAADGSCRVASASWALEVLPSASPDASMLLIVASAAVAAVLALLYRRRGRAALRLARLRRHWAEQARGTTAQFLGVVSHEVRTPMTGLLGFAELLLRTPLTPAQRRHAEGMLTAARHMLAVLDDALDLRRIESRRLVLDAAALDPAALLREVAQVLAPDADRAGLVLDCRIAADVPVRVRGDVRRLRQILLNLGANALQAGARRDIVLWLRRDGDALVFGVRDDGRGLAPRVQRQLFRPGARLPSGRRRGNGLGLAVSRELAAAMGGRLELDSRPGQGSEFRLRLVLPWIARTVEGVAEAPAAYHCDRPAGGPRLLLAMDGPEGAALAELLAALGHRVVRADDALAALAELDAGGIDVALIAAALPGLQGEALAGIWRRREAQSGAPRLALVLLVTVPATPPAAGQALDAVWRLPLSAAQLEEGLQRWRRDAVAPPA